MVKNCLSLHAHPQVERWAEGREEGMREEGGESQVGVGRRDEGGQVRGGEKVACSQQRDVEGRKSWETAGRRGALVLCEGKG